MLTSHSFSSLFILTLIFSFNLPLFMRPSHGFRRYVFVPDHVTWSEAQAYCREKHADLATFYSIYDIEMVWQCSNLTKCWIGLQRNKTNPDHWHWSDGREVSFTHWNQDNREPNGRYKNENCVFMRKQWWFDVNCGRTYPFVCYESEAIFVKENKTWEEALQHCRTLDMDLGSNYIDFDHLYDLLHFSLEGRNASLKTLHRDAQTDKVWIGLRFLAGHWLWVNGAPVKDQLPVCPAPGMYCGTMSKTGELVQLSNCLERRNFFCLHKN